MPNFENQSQHRDITPQGEQSILKTPIKVSTQVSTQVSSFDSTIQVSIPKPPVKFNKKCQRQLFITNFRVQIPPGIKKWPLFILLKKSFTRAARTESASHCRRTWWLLPLLLLLLMHVFVVFNNVAVIIIIKIHVLIKLL